MKKSKRFLSIFVLLSYIFLLSCKKEELLVKNLPSKTNELGVLGGTYWEKLDGKAIDIAISYNGVIFKIDNDNDFQNGGTVFKWNPGINRFELFGGRGVRISVDLNGNPWVVSKQGYIYKYNYNKWEFVKSDYSATDIACSANSSSIYVTTTNGSVINISDSDWTHLIGGANATSITADRNGVLWFNSTDYARIYKFIGSTKPDPLTYITGIFGKDVAVGGGNLFVTGSPNKTANNIYTLNGSIFQQLPGSAINIAVGNNDLPWVIDSYNNIYRRR